MKRWNKFFYRNPKGVIDSDSAWKLQNQLAQQNDVYKIVNLAGGGTLIDLYDGAGLADEPQELKRARIKQYFEEYLKPTYLVDESEVLTQKKYQEWHNKLAFKYRKLERDLYVEESATEYDLEKADAFSMATIDSVVFPYQDHDIKWRIDKRGAVGETPVHLLFLINSDKHIAIAEILLDLCPELVYDYYEGTEYYGESCLHFAIIQNNMTAIELILATKRIDLHARARGKFFLPVDVKRGDVILSKKQFQGYAYYGEYALSFAASLGNHAIYDLLIDAGCDPTRKDRYGNNLLHLTVIHDQPDMFYYAVKHQKVRADASLENNDGQTPLSLAAKLGKKEMFSKILSFSARTYWSYNKVSCSAYPLKYFDTIDAKGGTDWNSALMYIIRGKKDSHLDMLSDPVVHNLLEKKWENYGQKKFFRLLFFYVLHLIFLSVAIYLRPDEPEDLLNSGYAIHRTRFAFEILTLLASFSLIFFTIREVCLEGAFGFYQNVKSIPTRVTYIVGCFLTILAIVFRFTRLTLVEDWLVMIATPCIWSYCLFFLRNFSVTGPFITTIFRMFRLDLTRFVIIYSIIMLTFSLAFFVNFRGTGDENFTNFDDVLMTLFQQSFGEFNYESYPDARYAELAIFLFIIFMLFVHILLLNMLIAMMAQTFEKIKKLSKKIWRREWASMIIVMERSHSNQEKIFFQKQYGVNINASRTTFEGEAAEGREKKVKDEDTRAIMVVQVLNNSESQRRKGIQNQWKKAKHRTAFMKRNEKKMKKKLRKQKSEQVVINKFSSMVLIKQEAEEMMTDAVETDFDVDLDKPTGNIFRRKFSKSSNSSF